MASTPPPPCTAPRRAVPDDGGGWRTRSRDPLVVVAALCAASLAVAPSGAPVGACDRSAHPVRPGDIGQHPARPHLPWPAAISHDGSTVVYPVAQDANSSMLYALRTDQLEPAPDPRDDQRLRAALLARRQVAGVRPGQQGTEGAARRQRTGDDRDRGCRERGRLDDQGPDRDGFLRVNARALLCRVPPEGSRSPSPTPTPPAAGRITSGPSPCQTARASCSSSGRGASPPPNWR